MATGLATAFGRKRDLHSVVMSPIARIPDKRARSSGHSVQAVSCVVSVEEERPADVTSGSVSVSLKLLVCSRAILIDSPIVVTLN